MRIRARAGRAKTPLAASILQPRQQLFCRFDACAIGHNEGRGKITEPGNRLKISRCIKENIRQRRDFGHLRMIVVGTVLYLSILLMPKGLFSEIKALALLRIGRKPRSQ
jgi:hypothetical protein